MSEIRQQDEMKENKDMQETSWLRRYIWCFLFLCVIAFGSYLVYFECEQQPIPATIIRVGKITSRYHRVRHGHTKSYTTYHTTLTVVYEEDGDTRKDDVRYTYRNNWNPPRAGQQIDITTGLLGNKVQYPEDNLEIIGWVMIFFGCLFLGFAIRIAMVSGKENPYLIHPDDTPEAAGAPGLEIRKVTRLPNGNYYWTCEVDNEYEQDSYRITMLACGGICVFLLVVTLLFMRDMETLLIVTGCCAFVMLLAFGISKLMLLGPGHLRIPYEMSEEWIHIGTGKGSTYVSYKNVKQMKREGNKIRLQTAFTKSVVFIPEEDYEVISAYIFQRIREESHDYRG